MNGAFIFTEDFEDAVELFHTESARYAALLDDGRGFVAISDVDAARAFGLVGYGQVWMESPVDPADPRWEELTRPIRGPKRKVAFGDERFAMLAPTKSALDLYFEIAQWPALRGAVIVSHDLTPRVLIEMGDEEPPLETEWNLGVLDYLDSRLEVNA